MSKLLTYYQRNKAGEIIKTAEGKPATAMTIRLAADPILEDAVVITVGEQFMLRTVRNTQPDIERYFGLFSDIEVMQDYADGQTHTDPERIAKRIGGGWVKRASKMPLDPYNGMAVFDRASGQFMGHVVLGRSGQKGICELAALGHAEHWGKKNGSMLAQAVMNLARYCIENELFLDGHPLEKVTATSKVERKGDPEGVQVVGQLLRGLGFEVESTEVKHGAERFTYGISRENILKRFPAPDHVEEVACSTLPTMPLYTALSTGQEEKPAAKDFSL